MGPKKGKDCPYQCESMADISKCFQNLDSKISGEISTLSSEISSLKEEVKGIRTRVGEVESAVESASCDINNILESIVPALESKIEKETNERLSLELWGRKWNLVFRGIDGSVKESPDITDENVRGFMIDTLHLDGDRVNNMLFQAVHRLPNGQMGKRNIIVRFLCLMDRDWVLEKAIKALKSGSGYAVVPDLPPDLAKLRYVLLGKRRDMPEAERKRTKLVYSKDPPFLALEKKFGQ